MIIALYYGKYRYKNNREAPPPVPPEYFQWPSLNYMTIDSLFSSYSSKCLA